MNQQIKRRSSIYVYINNFRSIYDTFVELKSVTFLVGENSTGKTSFLHAVRLLNSIKLHVDFSINDLAFDNFSDYVHNKATSCDLGVISDNMFKLFTFISRDNVAVLSKLTINIENNRFATFIINNNDNSIAYKFISVEQSLKGNEEAIMRKIVEEHNLDNEGYMPVKLQKALSGRKLPQEWLIKLAIRAATATGAEALELTDSIEFSFQIPRRGECLWIAPIRAKPEKIYMNKPKNRRSQEGSHVPQYLKELYSPKKDNPNNLAAAAVRDAISEYGNNSNLFKKIKVNSFSKDELSPYRLNIKLNNKFLPINNLGYGVVQILPIITDIARSKNEIFLIQQPEVHLHPKAQAAFGQFLFEQVQNQFFVIETHSDFLIDRFRLLQKRSQNKKTAQILFFERIGEVNKVHLLQISEQGRYPDDQPDSFRDFFFNEKMELLEI